MYYLSHCCKGIFLLVQQGNYQSLELVLIKFSWSLLYCLLMINVVDTAKYLSFPPAFVDSGRCTDLKIGSNLLQL